MKYFTLLVSGFTKSIWRLAW